jgi:hypothetical protein
MKQLKHLKHILATYVYIHCNIHMKLMETTSETHLKQNMAPPATMAYLVGNCCSYQAALGEREDGERHARGVAVDHAASAQETQRRVVSGGGETGKQAAVLRHGAARHYIAAVVVRAWQLDRGGASRGDAGTESWLKNGW